MCVRVCTVCVCTWPLCLICADQSFHRRLLSSSSLLISTFENPSIQPLCLLFFLSTAVCCVIKLLTSNLDNWNKSFIFIAADLRREDFYLYLYFYFYSFILPESSAPQQEEKVIGCLIHLKNVFFFCWIVSRPWCERRAEKKCEAQKKSINIVSIPGSEEVALQPRHTHSNMQHS